MKKIFYLLTVLFTVQQLSAQVPEDAIRLSWNHQSGTARNQAIGGAAGSLGGDLTSVFVNPAGLGFYKTNEFVISPGFSLSSGSASFRGTNTNFDRLNKFQLGASGFVWGESNPRAKWSNKSFSLAINRSANFNSKVNYQGLNNYSSFSEAFVEDFVASGADIGDDKIYLMPVSYGTKLAVYNYLIDTVTTQNGLEVVGLPQMAAILKGESANLFQRNNIETTGGITEIAFGFAANKGDKVYLGASFGIPIMNYERTSTFTEVDADNAIDSFELAQYTERYNVQGVGINARLGVIFKPVDQMRAGFSVATPTIYGLRERTTGYMFTDLPNYLNGDGTSEADEYDIYIDNNVGVPEYRYDVVSPWRFLLSGTYMINAVEDVRQQRGFITADVEYVTHRSTRFSASEDRAYYDAVNEGVKLSYKSAVNLRVGGELKFNTLMTRLGFAYYGSPYEEKDFNARKMYISGGLGYRNKGIFVDLTYVHGIHRDVHFPYRLGDKANTYAELKNSPKNVLLTFGVKF